MAIMDLLDLCNKKRLLDVSIYDVEDRETIWSGPGDEVPGAIQELAVESFNVPTYRHMTINVHGWGL